MANEIVRIESWLSSRLLGDNGVGGLFGLVNGRIYPYVRPQNTTLPAVVYSYQAGSDVDGLGVNRVMTRLLYLVKVISQGAPSAAAKSAADRVEERIVVASLVKDGYVFSGRRDQPFSLVENDTETSTVYWHVGGLFRIECYPVG